MGDYIEHKVRRVTDHRFPIRHERRTKSLVRAIYYCTRQY